ncbi:hypothetical protein cypCar_00046151 [Cyprinus carpio]|nr:hypothetical protein cypCar_00046151 [Cyprinus carpio]
METSTRKSTTSLTCSTDGTQTGSHAEPQIRFSPTEHPEQDHVSLHSNRTLEEEVTWMQEMMRRRAAHSQDDPAGSRSRRKRFLSYPRFVELMVTADVKMVRHHGHNLEHYILTIMSVVSRCSALLFCLMSCVIVREPLCGLFSPVHLSCV